MNITRTIAQSESPEWVAEFFDGTRQGTGEWPFAQRVRDVHAGDFLFVIYRGLIVGRLEIAEVVEYDQTVMVPVGSDRRPTEARTVIWVRYPGDPAGHRNIPRRSHRNHRYDNVDEWGG